MDVFFIKIELKMCFSAKLDHLINKKKKIVFLTYLKLTTFDLKFI